METQLFMECDEEELEPWQQVDEDEVNFMEPVEDSPSPLPASETPPPRTPPITAQKAPLIKIVCSSVRPSPPPLLPPPLLPPPLFLPTPPLLPPPLLPPPLLSTPPLHPSVITSALSRLASSSKLSLAQPLRAQAPPLIAQGPPLFLTQTTGGTFLLPAAPGTRHATPILLTTQGFPVMNRGAPLLLNLQPGQTVQPLTLIQAPSLGQLIRPSVGVSQGPLVQTRLGPAPSRGSAFPATLTFRTDAPGPVNLQATQVGGATALKLAVSPALPSGSANGVPGIFSSAPGPAPPPTAPPRVVMTVEEFYYGTSEGDPALRKPLPLGTKTPTFTCQVCPYLAENNLRLMQHMLLHSELGGAAGDLRTVCSFCFRHFSSPEQLLGHEDQVHGPAHSTCVCGICEWAFESEPAFLNHMKSNHRPGEMPYVCQVCSYRSSFSGDIVQHFSSFHKDSRFLLCLFCLKVTRSADSYQQHLLRHQVDQAFHCNRCRLQFIYLKDKVQHKLENHRSFRRPAKLEGLPPGSKVTIRTYGKIRPLTLAGGRLVPSPAPLVQPISIKSSLNQSDRSPTKRPVSSRCWGPAPLRCVECGSRVLDFGAHYPSHARCLLCCYSSCCSRAYAAHMIHHHVPQSKDKVLPLHRLPPPCVFLLQCSHCGFSSQTADHMAAHLLRNPEHQSATCQARSPPDRDLQLCPSEEPPPPEEGGAVQKPDLLDPSWTLADRWTRPPECDGSDSSIASFQQSAGPHHFLSKNSDAIDFFQLLFPPELMELITNETNAHAKTSRFLGYGYSDWVPAPVHEIKAFLGLVVLMGVQNLPDPSHYWSWSHYDNSYTFHRAMSFQRFGQIAAAIRMGSFTTAEFRGSGEAGDPLHIFRPMLSILEGAAWDAYRPNCCLTVDRAPLPGPEGGCDPEARPQVWLLCDSKSGYCHRFFIQAGRPGPEQGLAVVPQLVKHLEDRHHQLYLAGSLASVPLMQKLLAQGIYASSSFPPLSRVLPRALWEDGGLDKPGDFLQRQLGPLLATRWRDTKEMGCLSTNADPGERDTVWRRSQTQVGGLDPIARPMAFCLLQENMRGVDICKQLLACNPLGGIPQDRRWRGLFWLLVNLSIVNAFIVLRESRKDNPPSWVQDGLFAQVNFRKRLGNQLAKCAQSGSERTEAAGSRGVRLAPGGAAVKERHRMGRVSSTSKRCRTCHLKNLRRESVSGCTACRANLCKTPSCFWAFHGLAPAGRGSTRVGFIKDRISGEITFEDGVDGAMPPVEDMDYSDGLEAIDDDDDVPEFIDEEKGPTSRPPSTTASAPGRPRPAPACEERGAPLTARQLRIALFALCEGLRQASRFFCTEPPLIRSWLKDAGRRLKSSEREQKWDANGGDLMVAWVLSMREQQLPITESNLFHKASTLKKKGGFSDSFRISYDWAVGFMLRHRLGFRSSGRAATLAHALPPSLEAKVTAFREFTQKVIRVNALPESAVAAMDELCLFVDLRLVQDKSRCSEALQLTGSLPLVTVYLAVLADGAMLPSLVLANRQLAPRALPDFILLETGPEKLLVEETLNLWTNKVWLKHLSGPGGPSKSLLVLDRHREHTGDPFLAAVGGAGTLPAVIPGGDSFRLQPLEVCMKPVLQRFLLSRWARFTRGTPAELEEPAPLRLQANVARLLVDWAAEALAQLHRLPQLWRESFRLTGLLPGRGAPPAAAGPEQIQAHFLKTLTETLLGPEALLGPETLLGPEALEADYSELLELEDKEDREEEQGEGKEASEEEQGEGKEASEEEQGEGKEASEEEQGEGKEASEEEQGEGKEASEEKEGEGKEASEEKEGEGKEASEEKEGKEVKRDREEIKEEGKEGKKEGGPGDTENETIKAEEERKKTDEDMKKEVEKLAEDSGEEGKETEEDSKEVSKERRETRIVIGEEVGDEWKITMKSRADGVEEG